MARKKKGHDGFGTIDRRGVGGQYRARIWINGKRCVKTFETEAGADAWLKAKRAEHLRPDRATRTVDAAQLTLADALKKRLDHISESKNHRNERYALARLKNDFPALCERSIYDIDEIDIQDFIAARRKQVAAATVNRDISILSHTFNLARTQFGCTHLRNPIGPTTRLKLPRGRVRRLSAEEERALLRQAAICEVTSSIRIGSIIRFANDTAMRCGEITGMRWEHVDLNKGTVYLNDTKNGDSRSVPLWLETRALLQDLGPLSAGPVWGGAHEAVRSAWRRVKAAAIREAESNNNHALAKSLRDLRFHDFRHEGTSRLIEQTGWENSHIQAVTGHKTSAMLARYTHLRGGDLAAKMAALEGGGAASRLARPERAHGCEELPAATKLRIAWQAVSANKDLLGVLIKARPIRDIAADFGISDGAVHKACGRLGIIKPGRGFWLRADAKAA